MVSGSSLRRPRTGLPWRQLTTMLAGIVVIVAMIVVAQTAQNAAERHDHTQVQVERARDAIDQMNVFIWLGMGGTWTHTGPGWVDQAQLAERGIAIYGEINNAMNALHRADPSPATAALTRDVGQLSGLGEEVLPAVMGGHERALPQVQQSLRLVFAALDRDVQAAAARQQRAANEASIRATVAYVGSLVIGLLVLTLLGLRLYRMRRTTLLSEQRRALERRIELRIRALVEHSSDVITVLAPDLTVRWQSPTIEKALGQPVKSLLGRRLTELVEPTDIRRVEDHIGAAINRAATVTFTARFRHANGEWRHLEAIAENRLADPLIEGVVLSMRDITERKVLEDQLRHQAFHDSLTGLANRALFEDRLTHALAGARRHRHTVGVLFLDLDDFKTINDSLGHSRGDELLRSIALRIAATVRVTDTAARLGGDEFAVLIEAAGDDEAEAIGERLLDALRPPVRIADRELRVTASIGLAKSDGSCGADELLRNADTAMYAAKEAGKGTMQAFETGMHQRVLDRLELTGEIQRALQREEFELDYQPIVDLSTAEICGVEALVRWAHPARGRLAPGHFIGLAEETGLIVPLGAWVLKSACAEGAEWERTFPARVLSVAVNVSTRQLHDPSFPTLVAETLLTSGLSPERLVLEITESLLPDDSDEILAQLHQLKDLGVKIAVDDFGTGYSALSRLQAYPIDILKIDRSFIAGMELDPGKAELVRGIINLGRSLNTSVVAEGIEEPEQVELLCAMRSPRGQGYLFSRPVSREQLQALIAADRPLVPVSVVETVGQSAGA